LVLILKSYFSGGIKMRSIKKLAAPLALVILFILTFSYAMKKNFEHIVLTKPSLSDTTDNPVNTPTDVSGMFNERGYYNSNSVSYDENEVISDFNGNLMYSIPMFKFKGPGDLSLDLSLNYNGSVNYQVVAAPQTQASQQTPLPIYNMTAPGWIFSLNGMAVQMLNFESNFFTHPSPSSDIVEGDGVRMLASGYNITERLRLANNIINDVLVIMLGDGSTVNLKRIQPVNQGCGEDGAACYIGEYFTTTKKSYIRAKVEYIDTQGWPSYRNRRVYVMKGDGLTYIYEETKNSYYDFPLNTGNQYLKPQVLVLKSIKDRFGHILNLYYDYSIKGRPVLTRINSSGPTVDGQWSGITYFLYQPQGAISVFNTVKGKYNIFCDNFSLDSAGHHLTSVNRIVNPYNDEINVTYEHYTRIAYNMRNDFFPHDTMTVKFQHNGISGGLKRMKTITNYNGGKREYAYLDNDPPSIGIDMTPPNPPGYFIRSDFYYGQGRDGFFVNMLEAKTTKDISGTNIKTESFTYYYDANRGDENTEAINENDEYYTKRDISAYSSEYNNNTPTSQGSIKYYKNFRLQPAPVYGINPDWNGETKLVMERFYAGDVNEPYRKTFYQFEKGNMPNGGYDGSFLDTAVTDTLKQQIRKQAFRYGHASTPLENDNDNPITQKTVYDPLKQKTITDYNIYYGSIEFYWAGHYSPSGTQLTDATMFYLTDQPSQIRIFSPSETQIYKEEMVYNSSTTSTAYIGQLLNKKVYDPNNSSYFQETQYKYYRNDTLGMFLYASPSLLPTNEGLLKEIIDPNGASTKYYYRPAVISSSDPVALRRTTEQTPKIIYKKAYENNSVVIDSAYWHDTRLPVRIDSYNSSGKYTSKYMQYNLAGLITKSLDNNGFITEFQYDNIDRVTRVTLPYDYSTSELPDSTAYDTTFLPVDYRISSTEMGNKNGNTITLYDNDDNDLLEQFKIDKELAGGPETNPGDFDITAVVRFPDDKFLNLDTVFLATVEFFSYNNYHSIDNDTSSSQYKFQIRPFKTLNNTGSSWEFGSSQSYHNNINAYSNLLTPSCISWPEGLKYRYYAGYNILDITYLMNQNIGNDFKGLMFNILPSGSFGDPPPIRAKMDLSACIGSIAYIWEDYFSPAVHIQGIYKQVTSRLIRRFGNSTLEYIYKDDSNKVIVASQIDKPSSYRYKQTEYTFDGFYRLMKIKNLATGDTSFTYYNYLDQKGKTIDARGNATKFSYDTLGYMMQTQNADISNAYNRYEYVSNMPTYFGSTYYGVVEVRKYTDETNRQFVKYFDAVGNLLREIKYVAGNGNGDPQQSDNPYDPDTTYSGQDLPGQTVPLITDYLYDDLYRVEKVKTPQGKEIEYTYDIFGRQTKRETVDAGITKYWYDMNNNLRFSQDSVQRTFTPQKYTERTYDGISRLLTISEYTSDPENPEDAPTSGQLFIVNCYDTLAQSFTPFYSIFSNVPSNYYGTTANNTNGAIVATAYRTQLTDNWSFKFYRYDGRGRVIRFWHYMPGLGWKSEDYHHNSQNQVIRNRYQPGLGDGNMFTYTYDNSARLSSSNLYVGSSPDNPDDEGDSPTDYIKLSGYTYNQNSQISTHKLNHDQHTNTYGYNNRNWIQNMNTGSGHIFKYVLLYNPNGNIRLQSLEGTYNNNFTDQDDYKNFYTYDESNRLTFAEYTNLSSSNPKGKIINNYDKDGNFTVLKRNDANNTSIDDFAYDYYTGTNMLKKVNAGSSKAQYSYDGNGNMFKDEVNKNYNILYDHRNLMTDIRTIRQEAGGGPVPSDVTYWTVYKYDEAGNRVRKSIYKYTGSEPDPVYDNGGDNPLWETVSDEFYVRDVGGKDIAIYSSTTLTQWNLWGLDQIGHMKSDTTKYYYLKDHLGSAHAIISSTNTVTSAQDYDAWGYLLRDRSYNLTDMKYDYTSKERDTETNYDYFGARYYDARIARWGQIEPYLDQNLNYSPYCYSSNSPIVKVDIDGKDDYYYSSRENYVMYPKKSDNDYYYVQSDQGNVEYDGKMYFLANSKETVELYDWYIIDTEFETGKFVEAFNAAKPEDMSSIFFSPHLYAFDESVGGKMDQKLFTLSNEMVLSVLNGIAYNKNEAGNIVWGAVMAYMGFTRDKAQEWANTASERGPNKRKDEDWDQRSVGRGVDAYHENKSQLIK
jgi:RHS repeat-associated protein